MEDADVQLTVEKLFAMCVDRNLRGEQNILSAVLSQATYAQCWEAFVKWLLGQFDLGRAVNCHPFATMGYNATLESNKSVCVDMAEAYLLQHGLTFKLDERECPYPFSPGPSIKINYAGIAKTGNLEKSIASTAVNNIFELIGDLLSQKSRIEIDLGVLGKLASSERAVKFHPVSKAKTAYLFGKSTVKNLMELSRAPHEKLPAIEGQIRQITPVERRISYGKVKDGNSNPTLRDTRNISIDMLGAGLNPNARVINYSSLASDPEKMMTTMFKKPPLANTRFPPVLDIFSRTVAAPVSFNKQYLPPSVRIASNYNPEAKRLIIDSESRSIQFIPIETSVTLTANTNPMIPQIPTGEGYPIIAHGVDTETLKKDYNYKRYNHYIENEISTEVIAPIRQYWIHNILDLVPAE